MRQISEEEFNLDPELWQKKALAEPVVLTEKGIPKLYLMSKAVFDSLYKGSCRALSLLELDEQARQALLSAEVAPEYEHLDALMKED